MPYNEYYRKNYQYEMNKNMDMMDMKKSTRNLISLSGSYSMSSVTEKVTAENYIRYGHDEWEPKIEILDAGEMRTFQKLE